MLGAWILQSKLKAPAVADGLLARTRLSAEEASASVMVFQAGPGYGKTQLMRALAGNAPTVWFTLDAYDTDVASFFHYLVAGVREHVPQFGDEVEVLLAGDRLEPRRLWEHFFQAIASYNLPALTLVLDDVHHLFGEQAELVKALAYFFDKLPPTMRLFLASRKRFPIQLSRLQSRGLVCVLEQEALRFSPDEVEALLAQRSRDPQTLSAWRQRAEALDGWPLGLELLGVARGGRAPMADTHELTAYVAEELYAAQREDQQAFLLQASLLHELTPEACRAVIDVPDAAERLAELEQDHLCQRLGDGTAFRFPTYLKDFLALEVARVVPGPTLVEQHRHAAAFYEAQGQAAHALPHRLAAKDWAGALAVCDACLPAMRYDGRQGLIARWVAAFPEHLTLEEPRLAMWRGHLRSQAGETTSAIACYEQALALFREHGDAAGEFKVLVRLFGLAVQLQDTLRSGRLIREALALAPLGLPEDIVDLHLARSLAADQRGDLALVRECTQAALLVPLDDNVEIAASHAIAHLNMVTLDLHQGRLADAHHHAERTIAIAERWQLHPFRLLAGFLQADLRLTEGDLEGAGAFLRSLPASWREALDWHGLGCAHAVIGHLHALKGEHREAEEALARSLAVFKEAGHALGTQVPIERLAWLAISRRQFARVGALVDEAAAERSEPNVYDLALWIPKARASHLAGDPAASLATLERVIPACDGLEARLLGARARLYEAPARAAAGDAPGARTALAAAGTVIEAHGYHFLRTQDQRLWEELGALDAPAPTRVPDAPVAAASRPPAGAGEQLEILCFGGLEVRRAGVLLDQWPRRRAKLILAALLLHPRGLSVEDMAELLGATELTPTLVGTYQVDISALRRSLEPSLGKGETSRCILLTDGRYHLNWELVASVDVQGFEQALVRGDAARERPEEALAHYEAALELYREALLADKLYLPFFESQREHLRRRAVDTLLWAAERHAATGDVARGEAALQRAIAIAPCEEEAYLALMRHFHAQGRPVMVRKTYFDCRKAFKARLDAEPSEHFEGVYRQVG